MRLADAPPPGWYPDPEGLSRLRWWEGTDWSDIYRPPPTPSELMVAASAIRRGLEADASGGLLPHVPGTGDAGARRASDAAVAQARQVARGEVDRAVDMLGRQARYVRREIEPLISEYTSKLARVARRVLIVAAVALVAWLVFQAIAQQSFFEWLGDRLDNLGD